MTYEILCYVLIFWMQVYGLADCFSEKGSDRFCGMVTLALATAILFSTDWMIQ